MRRRTVLRAGLGLAAAGLTGCSPGEYRGPQRVVTLAAGEPGGFYVEFARLLAAELNAAEPVLRCEVHETRGSVAGAVPSLVNVNLSNVLNNLALDLKVDKANIPINAQIPINIAANVCGVSINVLSIGAGGGKSLQAAARAPRLLDIAKEIRQRFLGRKPVGKAGKAAVNRQCSATVRVGGSKQDRKRRALGNPEQRRLLHAGGIHDRTEVVHADVEAG